MPNVRHPALVVLATMLLSFGACDDSGSSGDESVADGASEGADDDGTSEASDDATTMEARCESEDRDDAFALGLAHEGSTIHVEIADADPALPIRGDNAWTIAITDEGGAAMDGMALEVAPWMPDHGHGSPVPVAVTPLDDGRYELSPINLFMAGYWEITIRTEEPEDAVVFKVCVE